MSLTMEAENCCVCKKRISKIAVVCDCCEKWCHLRCQSSLSSLTFQELRNEDFSWTCPTCEAVSFIPEQNESCVYLSRWDMADLSLPSIPPSDLSMTFGRGDLDSTVDCAAPPVHLETAADLPTSPPTGHLTSLLPPPPQFSDYFAEENRTILTAKHHVKQQHTTPVPVHRQNRIRQRAPARLIHPTAGEDKLINVPDLSVEYVDITAPPPTAPAPVSNDSDEEPPRLYEDSKYNGLTYQIVKGATQTGRDMLIDSNGYSYTVGKSRTSRYWRCSVRNQSTTCRATVTQKGDKFTSGAQTHIHLPKLHTLKRAVVTAKIKAKARKRPFKSAVEIVKKILKKENATNLDNHDYLVRIANRVQLNYRPTKL